MSQLLGIVISQIDISNIPFKNLSVLLPLNKIELFMNTHIAILHSRGEISKNPLICICCTSPQGHRGIPLTWFATFIQIISTTSNTQANQPFRQTHCNTQLLTVSIKVLHSTPSFLNLGRQGQIFSVCRVVCTWSVLAGNWTEIGVF